jgi:hypothetical protein
VGYVFNLIASKTVLFFLLSSSLFFEEKHHLSFFLKPRHSTLIPFACHPTMKAFSLVASLLFIAFQWRIASAEVVDLTPESFAALASTGTW